MWFKFIVVGIRTGDKGRTAEVFLKYKGNDSPFHVPDQQLAAFCLPLGPDSQSQKERMSHEEYIFTLTQGDGTRVQGFCRRFLPPAPRVGSKLRYPQVLCLVCEPSWSALFFKVLEATEQLLRQTDLLLDFSNHELPVSSYAGQFLASLAAAVVEQPQLGSVVRLQLPAVPAPLSMSPPRRIYDGIDSTPLQFTNEILELQVPPNSGNGTSNAGISLARLLWHVPVPAMLTLIASLLLERRVLVVGQSRDTVSAAVAAAAALIYPFKWHHIYLPLLPRSFKDYLTAPMPFLIGMPAQLLPTLKGIPMDEVTLIDLDLARCEPSAGSMRDDAVLLPWKEQLEAALHAAFGMLRSPTEHESNPLITNIMQGYFLKLIGQYRSHVYPEGVLPSYLLHSPSSMHQSSSTGSLSNLGGRQESFKGLSGIPSPRNGQPSPRDGGPSGRQTPIGHDDTMKGHGYWFDHPGLVMSHRHNERARSFLGMLRQSQMYEVFIQERLKMLATVKGGPEFSGDPFEQLVNSYLDNRSRKLAARLGSGMRSGFSRLTAFVKKHRRTGSHVLEGVSNLGHSLAGLADSPEAQRVKHLAATFASVATGAGEMRRNLTEGNDLAGLSSDSHQSPAVPHHRHTMTSVEHLADKISSALDPSAFFDNEEEDEQEAEDAAAVAAAASSAGGRKGVSFNSSSSSLKDLASGAGGMVALPQQSLQRQSVPVGGSSSSSMQLSAAGASASTAGLARGSVPMIELRDSSPSRGSNTSRPNPTMPPAPPPLASHYLQLQQQQLQHQRPPRSSLSSIADQLYGSNSNVSAGLGQQQQHRPRSPASATALAAAAGPTSVGVAPAAAVNQRTCQHLHMKAALASMSPGPLPQPPLPKPRSSASHLPHFSVLSSGLKPPLQHQQQQQHVVSPGAAPAPSIWDPFAELVAERSSSGLVSSQSGQLQSQQPQQQQQQQPQSLLVGEDLVMQLGSQPAAGSSIAGSCCSSSPTASKAISSSRGTSSSSGGGVYVSSNTSTDPAVDAYFASCSEGIASSTYNAAGGVSLDPLQQQQQHRMVHDLLPPVSDLLHLDSHLPGPIAYPLVPTTTADVGSVQSRALSVGSQYSDAAVAGLVKTADLLDLGPSSGVGVVADSRISSAGGPMGSMFSGSLESTHSVNVARSDSLLDM